MARYTLNMIVDASLTYVCTVNKKRDLTAFEGTAFVSGTFGSGTVTLFVSPDGGTTKVPLLNTAGTAISIAAAAMAMFRLAGSGSTNSDSMMIYATLAGSTNANLNVTVYDNN